jgi:hypothetical protein
MKYIGATTPGHSVKNTARYFRKYGSVFVPSKDPWCHLHPRHLVKEFRHEG